MFYWWYITSGTRVSVRVCVCTWVLIATVSADSLSEKPVPGGRHPSVFNTIFAARRTLWSFIRLMVRDSDLRALRLARVCVRVRACGPRETVAHAYVIRLLYE